MKPHIRETQEKRKPSVIGRLVYLILFALIGWGGYQAIYHPDTPLPRQWNPTVPLQVADPISPLTVWKMERALMSTQSCLAVLEDAGRYDPLADLESSDNCHIRGRINLRGVGDTALSSIETRCAIGLRLAMWEQHDLQPSAKELFRSAFRFGGRSQFANVLTRARCFR